MPRDGDEAARPAFTSARRREIVARQTGVDPGELGADARLDDVLGGGLGRLLTVAAIEDAYEIELPADLLAVLETVDDLVHVTRTKVGHRT